MKTWNGPTPYNGYRAVLESDRNNDQYLLGRADGLEEGYHTSMNSPEVRAMYEALINHKYCDADNERETEALAAYEAGLKEDA